MKSFKLKKIIAAVLAVATIVTVSPVGASAAWKQDSHGWWNTEGNSYSVGWRSINGSWYYFDSVGYMKTGWVNDRGTWYYMQSSGAMKTGWLNVGGAWYYMQSSGAMKTGWVNDNGIWYYMQPSGAMKTGWINDNGTWYFASISGAMQTGVVKVDNKVYCLAANGTMQVGNIVINGETYTFDASGAAIGDKIPETTNIFYGSGVQLPVPDKGESTGSSSGGGGSHHSSHSDSSLSDLSDGKTHNENYTINKAGTFGNSENITTVNGNVTIAKSNALSKDKITLQNLNINGNITIDFGAGDVILDNVKVNGVDVSNIGANSLHVKGDSSIKSLKITDTNNDAHIVIEGNAEIEDTEVFSGANLEVAENAKNVNPFAKIKIATKSAKNKVELKGDFNNIEVEKAADVVVKKGSTIQTILVDENVGKGTIIEIPQGVTVDNLNLNAAIDVKGAGKIKTANIGVSGTNIETKPEKIGVKKGVTVNINGKPVKEGDDGVVIIPSVPGESVSFQEEIEKNYAEYAKVKINKTEKQPSDNRVSFTVKFEKDADSNVGGSEDYVTQDILVTNPDGTDVDVEYNDGVYTVKAGSKVYSSVRVYRNGQIGYVTSKSVISKNS